MGNAVLLSDDRYCVRIPFDEPIAPLDLGPLIDEQPCAVRDTVPCFLSPRLVQQNHLSMSTHYNGYAGRADDDIAVLDLDRRIKGGLDRRLLCPPLRCTADMKRPHRQLRAGLTDRLGGYHADRFADVDNRATS